jgi:hypothetical protein
VVITDENKADEQTIFECVTLIIPNLETRTRQEGDQTAMFYDDDRLHICRRTPEQSFEVYIRIPQEGDICVYRASVTEQRRVVYVIRRGRWMTHLSALAEAAREVKRQRSFDIGARLDTADVNDDDLFPELDLVEGNSTYYPVTGERSDDHNTHSRLAPRPAAPARHSSGSSRHRRHSSGAR